MHNSNNNINSNNSKPFLVMLVRDNHHIIRYKLIPSLILKRWLIMSHKIKKEILAFNTTITKIFHQSNNKNINHITLNPKCKNKKTNLHKLLNKNKKTILHKLIYKNKKRVANL